MKKTLIASILFLILAFTGLYLYADRSVMALKTGKALPLQWDEPYFKQEEPIRLTTQTQMLSTPHVYLTPIYYLPDSKKLQFGLWYNKKEYKPDPSKKIPDRIFQVTVTNQDGQSFEKDTVIKTAGVFDEFQRRSIAIDLSDQDSITITVASIKQDKNTLTSIESSSFDVRLK